MCARYGLDPRFPDDEIFDIADSTVSEGVRSWARRNAGEVLLPTGRNRRNLNPLIVSRDGSPALEQAWWGFLVDGEPARFPSINTRSERLRTRPGDMRTRALVPATAWFERQRSSRVWHEFALDTGNLFGIAAVTRPGRTADGEEFTCFSIVMRPAPPRLADVHDRMPLLVPSALSDEWLHEPDASRLIDRALSASEEIAARITVRPQNADAPETLF